MKHISFDWNENKNISNQRKHGIYFTEAKTVFFDENARLIHDPDHSDTEDRFVLIGLSVNFRLLVVIHTYRKDDEKIRIISARKATKIEINYYQRNK
jgi:uncharacterized protein